VYETPDEVKSLESKVDGDMDVLATKLAGKRTTLDASLKLEHEKEELRLEYSNKVNNFSQYVEYVVDTCLIVMPFERDSRRLGTISARSRR
jgi:hypothetical protein